MVMMVDKLFCDTNIILRAYHDVFPQHNIVKAAVDHQLSQGCDLWISRQVIREYLVQVTHPRTFDEPYAGQRAVQLVSNILKTCYVTNETDTTTSILLKLLEDYPVSGKQIHDANIVASMLANDIDTLLTLNASDFNRYGDRITVLVPGEA